MLYVLCYHFGTVCTKAPLFSSPDYLTSLLPNWNSFADPALFSSTALREVLKAFLVITDAISLPFYHVWASLHKESWEHSFVSSSKSFLKHMLWIFSQQYFLSLKIQNCVPEFHVHLTCLFEHPWWKGTVWGLFVLLPILLLLIFSALPPCKHTLKFYSTWIPKPTIMGMKGLAFDVHMTIYLHLHSDYTAFSKMSMTI